MKNYLYVLADPNDADYIQSLTEVNDSDLEVVKKVISVIKSINENHNWPTGEYEDKSLDDLYGDKLCDEDYEVMSNYVPYGEYGVHTIIRIDLLKVESEETLL